MALASPPPRVPLVTLQWGGGVQSTLPFPAVLQGHPGRAVSWGSCCWMARGGHGWGDAQGNVPSQV